MPNFKKKKFNEFEKCVHKAFVALAKSIGLRPATGIVTATLYFSDKPISMTEIERQLDMSHGSVYGAIETLKKFGALKIVKRAPRAADTFELEPRLRTLALNAIYNNFLPAISTAASSLSAAKSAKNVPATALPRIDSLLHALDFADEQLKLISALRDGNGNGGNGNSNKE